MAVNVILVLAANIENLISLVANKLESGISGVVANYLASEVREPGSIPICTKKIHNIYYTI